jgi:hypothetical protein
MMTYNLKKRTDDLNNLRKNLVNKREDLKKK